METQHVILVSDVWKVFQKHTVLSGVSMQVKRGEIVGIVGRNGSGKSVLLQCILGLLRADKGSISVMGKNVGKDIEMAHDTGFLINRPGFLGDCSGIKNLRYLASIRNRTSIMNIHNTMQRVGLDSKNKKPVGKYSMGMMQRLGIAQALMEEPDLLILDEPMSGLDQAGVDYFRHLFLSMKEEGKTFLLTSHSREDIDLLCDIVYEIDNGQIAKTPHMKA